MAGNVIPLRPRQRELFSGPRSRLDLYVQPGPHRARVLAEELTNGLGGLTGIVFDLAHLPRQCALLVQARDRGIDCVLDTMSQRLAEPGGYSATLAKQLPWAPTRPERPEDLDDEELGQRAFQIAKVARQNDFSAILTPTHVLRSIEDPWIRVDFEQCRKLRQQLDRIGHGSCRLYYSLSLPLADFRDHRKLEHVLQQIEGTPIDALWLQIRGFGRRATGVATESYAAAAERCRKLGLPLVAERVGGLVGASLMALGAVDGLACGVAERESLDIDPFPKKRGGRSGKRTYCELLDDYISLDEARFLLGMKGIKSRFGPSDTSICPNGIRDFTERPENYWLRLTSHRVGTLSSVAPSLRGREFHRRWLEPAQQNVVFLAGLSVQDERLRGSVEKKRIRLARWVQAVTALLDRPTSGSSARERGVASGKIPDAARRED